MCRTFVFLMFDRYLTVHRAGIQMTVFLALVSMSLFIGSAALTQLHIEFLGFSPAEADTLDQLTPAMATPMKWIQLLGLMITMGLPAALFGYLAYPQATMYLGLKTRLQPLMLVLGAIVLVSALPLSAWLEIQGNQLPVSKEMTELTEKYAALSTLMLAGSTWLDLAFNVLVIAIAPAILEELFFRACLQQILLRWFQNKALAPILITGFIFSLMHFEASGFLSRFFLGALLGWAYYFSGSLWVPILMHFMNNAVAVVGYFLYQNHYIHTNITETPSRIPAVWILAGLSALAVFSWLFMQNGKAHPAWEYNDETPQQPQPNAINHE